MRFTEALLVLAAGAAQAGSTWGFDEGTVTVLAKRSSTEGEKYTFGPKSALSVPVASESSISISLTAKDNGKAKRPHQAFVMLKDEKTGLEAPFPMIVRENGKASVSISQKEIPVQLLLSNEPLRASVIIASFGSAQGLDAPIFDLNVQLDPSVTPPAYEKPVRYGKRPEMHHIFRPDPRNPPRMVSLFFALVVAAAVPALFVGWLALGANMKHLGKAMSAAPLSHATFVGSIIAMEFIFFMYYTSWNLFQTLPVIGVVGVVMVLSGSKALGEVQSRRFAGER